MRALHVRLCFINAFVLFYPLKLQQVLVHYLLFFSNVFFLREFTILYAVVKVLLVGSSGLEPPTSRLSGARSNQLSYEPSYGGDERVRTDGLLLARQALSQLSYTPTQFPASLAGSSLKVLLCTLKTI